MASASLGLSYTDGRQLAAENESSFKKAALKNGFCSAHPDVKVVFKTFFSSKNVPCARCETIFKNSQNAANNSGKTVDSDNSTLSSKVGQLCLAEDQNVGKLGFKILGSTGSSFKLVNKPLDGHNQFYYVLPHNAKYKVEAKNPFLGQCKVKVTIDGFEMGQWRMDAKQTVSFERPVSEAKLFTFLRCKMVADAEAANAAYLNNGKNISLLTPEQRNALDLTVIGSGVVGGRAANGLVTVTYTPKVNSSQVRLVDEDGEQLPRYGDELTNVLCDDTVASLIDISLRGDACSCGKAALFYKGSKLLNTRTLGQCNFAEECPTLVFHHKITVNVKHGSKKFSLTLSASEGMWKLSNLIAKHENYDTDKYNVCLSLNGRDVEDGGDVCQTLTNNCELTVVFQKIPEQEKTDSSDEYCEICPMPCCPAGSCGDSYAAGGTTLQGDSNQKFGKKVTFEGDDSRAIESSVRLVCDADEVFDDSAKRRADVTSKPAKLSTAGAEVEDI